MDFKTQPHYVEVSLPVKTWGFYRRKMQPFFFNMAAWWSLWELNDFDWEKIDKMPVDAKNAQLIYAAARQGSYVNNRVFRYSFEEFIKGLGKMYSQDEAILKRAVMASIPIVEETSKKMQGAKKK